MAARRKKPVEEAAAAGQTAVLEPAKPAELVVVYRDVSELVPYVNNARTHSPAQVDQIAASIKAFGFNNPILIDGSGVLIAGHGRLLAAQKLRMQQVPTVSLAHLSESQRKAYILADNRIALNAGWDEDLLKLEIAEPARDRAWKLENLWHLDGRIVI